MEGPVARLDTLREELMALVGVADADVDTSGAAASGVRVRLAPGADARVVGVEVQRVLASHGLRSRVADGEVIAPPEGSAAAKPVIPDVPLADARPAVGLGSVLVEESLEGVNVSVSASDGRTVTESAEATEEGIIRAVVSAVGSLAHGRGARLMWMTRSEEGGEAVVSLVLEQGDGARRAGAAIVRGGLPHAVARAAWSALTS